MISILLKLTWEPYHSEDSTSKVILNDSPRTPPLTMTHSWKTHVLFHEQIRATTCGYINIIVIATICINDFLKSMSRNDRSTTKPKKVKCEYSGRRGRWYLEIGRHERFRAIRSIWSVWDLDSSGRECQIYGVRARHLVKTALPCPGPVYTNVYPRNRGSTINPSPLESSPRLFWHQRALIFASSIKLTRFF